ncbi:MAG: glycosyltransferase family 4 protein [Nitrospinae bacterium]|nr:glycosyltransferase family 4 protein [Nitrospinota bacterium]
MSKVSLHMLNQKILCIVPFSPPVTGMSIASETIVKHLEERHQVTVIQYQKGNLNSGNFSLGQFVKVVAIGFRLRFIKKDFDSVYLVLSSSFWGNIRDLGFLFMMGKNLRRRTVLHLHGVNFKAYLISFRGWLKSLNRHFLKDVKNAIVLGESFKNIFNGYISDKKIRIVKNFFDPSLLIQEEHLIEKFSSSGKVKILFLSNLIREKGFESLLDLFLSLPREVKSKAELHFAGEMKSLDEKAIFLKKIHCRDNIVYHGPVKGREKLDLFQLSHIFCLPTVYHFEGQPISIIEAYAAGCVVLTTRNGGIQDIFEDEKNGYYINKPFNGAVLEIDIETFGLKLTLLIEAISNFKNIAYFNRLEAIQKYSQNLYCENMENIIVKSIEIPVP